MLDFRKNSDLTLQQKIIRRDLKILSLQNRIKELESKLKMYQHGNGQKNTGEKSSDHEITT
jgi:hypothetical protein